MKEMTREEMEQKYATLDNEKLNGLYQQVRKYNPNLYVQAVPRVVKHFRWSNPFRPIIEEYDDYTTHRITEEGKTITIYHDYRSLKSYLIGILEGVNLVKAPAPKPKKKKRTAAKPYHAPQVRTESKPVVDTEGEGEA